MRDSDAGRRSRGGRGGSAGFLGLEDLITDQGEYAVIFNTNDQTKEVFIEAQAKRQDQTMASAQDAYLTASLSSVLPDLPRQRGQSEKHYRRQNLVPLVAPSGTLKSSSLSPYPHLRQENVEIFKYTPVTQKVKPILGDLPSKLRIVRNIVGDPLRDLPDLSPKPPELKSCGWYTEARKQVIDKMHNDGFPWSEEQK